MRLKLGRKKQTSGTGNKTTSNQRKRKTAKKTKKRGRQHVETVQTGQTKILKRRANDETADGGPKAERATTEEEKNMERMKDGERAQTGTLNRSA